MACVMPGSTVHTLESVEMVQTGQHPGGLSSREPGPIRPAGWAPDPNPDFTLMVGGYSRGETERLALLGGRKERAWVCTAPHQPHRP